ncbi:hypothetical protein BPAE_0009g00330 [Botrytis paeoniae]|uniref:Uncharacterized protein n=1 Tax=Botrytis paeoniae TaxID=278948 RepID=A0A4Z1G7F6_9HELO|nr:hypothetical protein BPAE_0009g00330 [Botrytis paeoniae]
MPGDRSSFYNCLRVSEMARRVSVVNTPLESRISSGIKIQATGLDKFYDRVEKPLLHKGGNHIKVDTRKPVLESSGN